MRWYITIWNRGQFLQKNQLTFLSALKFSWNKWWKPQKTTSKGVLPTILLLINSVLLLGACAGYCYNSTWICLSTVHSVHFGFLKLQSEIANSAISYVSYDMYYVCTMYNAARLDHKVIIEMLLIDMNQYINW